MLFSRGNFLIPLNSGDITLRIRNIDGTSNFVITDEHASITTAGRTVAIRQGPDVKPILLEFSVIVEASGAAHDLQAALNQIKKNKAARKAAQQPSVPGQNTQVHIKNISIIMDGQDLLELNAMASKVMGLYVNGQLIENHPNEVNYVFQGNVIRWVSGMYPLSIDDKITVHFIT